MITAKTFFFLILLFASYVLAHDDLQEIDGQCKDGKVVKCEGKPAGVLFPGEFEAAAGTNACKDKDGGKDAGGKDGGKDAGGKDAGGKDAGGKDAGGKDAGGKDAGGKDAGGKDAGGKDAGGKDAGGKDAGGADAGGKDAGGKDAGGKDAGGKDAGGKDAGGKDAGGKDAGGKDAGGKDTGGKDAGGKDAGGKDCDKDGGKDAGGKDAGGKDAGGKDTGGKDAGGKDTGGKDAGGKDAGGKDCDKDGGKDAGGKDAGGKDAGGKDTGGKDAGGKDAGGKDAGGKDAGGKDAGGKDAGGKDGGKDAGGKDGGKDTGGKDGGKDAGGKGKDAGGKGKDAGGKDTGGKGKGGSFYDPQLYGKPPFETDYKGEWVIDNPNVGVNAMQYQLMPNNKAVWFDTTNLGPSTRELGPKGNCPANPDMHNEPDCYAHGVQYDVETGEVVSVYVKTDPWCSSGHLLPTGDLLSTGGNKLGDSAVRLFSLTDPEPKFIDREKALGAPRWYASNAVLEDGSAVIVGGRDSYSYDLIPPQFDFKPTVINLPFLQQTTEPATGPGLHIENNLYPFVYMLPDGNVFIFANDRAISFEPKTGKTVKEYPVLQGGSRNYPPSGQSALFPLRLSPDNSRPIPAEVVVCGGNQKDAFQNIDARFTQNRVFTPALKDCNRLKVFADKPVWEKEQDMPSPRTMGDLLQLPNTHFLLINGAKKGTSGWEDGEDPNMTPTVYMPDNEMGKRFKELNPTNIPRMYHSTSSVLPDGKILVAGSNAHEFYTFDGPFPTELRVEKFSPHYLDPKLDNERPVIKEDATDKVLKYGKPFKLTFTVKSNKNLEYGDILLTLLYPPFTTHGFSQNQRMLITGIEKVDKNVISAVAPASGKVAPPGYYLMFVVHRDVPSKGMWVHID